MFHLHFNTMQAEKKIVGISLSKPHINRYYEKIAVLMYVSVCVSVICHPCALLGYVMCGPGRARVPALTLSMLMTISVWK